MAAIVDEDHLEAQVQWVYCFDYRAIHTPDIVLLIADGDYHRQVQLVFQGVVPRFPQLHAAS
jgi:hypothetical protein